MINIREVMEGETTVLNDIVSIHLNTFTGFFLTFMGKGFLFQMYRSYCDHEKSTLLVAEEEGSVVGFLAYSSDFSGLYKHMLKKRLFKFAFYSIGAFFRKPSVFFHIIRAFLKPGEAKREESYVEISSIGVNPSVKNRGIGTKLIKKVKDQVDFENFAYISLETDAMNNDTVITFYIKNGFEKHRLYETNEGRKMFELRYYGGNR